MRRASWVLPLPLMPASNTIGRVSMAAIRARTMGAGKRRGVDGSSIGADERWSDGMYDVGCTDILARGRPSSSGDDLSCGSVHTRVGVWVVQFVDGMWFPVMSLALTLRPGDREASASHTSPPSSASVPVQSRKVQAKSLAAPNVVLSNVQCSRTAPRRSRPESLVLGKWARRQVEFGVGG